MCSTECIIEMTEYIIHIDASFTKVGCDYITRVVELFKDVKFNSVSHLNGGNVFGDAWKGFEFYVHPRSKNGFSVQFAKEGYSDKYMFGIEFDVAEREATAYHHPYGPFTAIYGIAYECD